MFSCRSETAEPVRSLNFTTGSAILSITLWIKGSSQTLGDLGTVASNTVLEFIQKAG